MVRGSVHADDTAVDRGRIEAHHLTTVFQLHTLNIARRRAHDKKRRAYRNRIIRGAAPDLAPAVQFYFMRRYTCARAPRAHTLTTRAICAHYGSYDKVTRAMVLFSLPPVDNPLVQLDQRRFYRACGFWKYGFQDIVGNLALLPGRIRDESTGCTVSRQLGVFICLRRWHKEGTWDDVAEDIRRNRTWAIAVYGATLRLLVLHYRRCVQVRHGVGGDWLGGRVGGEGSG